MDETGAAITVSGLGKQYGQEVAVDEISFDIREGEIFGILGPNGAGKTTTMSILATLVDPTEGSAQVMGHDIQTVPDAVRDTIGVVFQETALDDWLTGRENLEFHARMHGVPADERQDGIEEMLDLVNLQDDADRQVEDYSGGMKRRLEIARGLLHAPDVLFLDEPTLGLDAETKRSIWNHIERLNEEEGLTIVLTTHYMEEADRLCDRTAIMQDGRIQALDSPDRLKADLGGDILQITVSNDPRELESLLDDLDWVQEVARDGLELSITAQDAERHVGDLVDQVEESGCGLETLNMRRPSLEDVFLQLTGERLGGDR